MSDDGLCYKKKATKIGRVCCLKISNDIRMQTQVVITLSYTFLICFLLILMTKYLTLRLMMNAFEETLSDVFSERTKLGVQSVTVKIIKLTNRQFISINRDIKLFDNFFQLNQSDTKSQLLLFDSGPFAQIPYQNEEPIDFNNSRVCYSWYDQQNVVNISRYSYRGNYINSINQLNQIYPLQANPKRKSLSSLQFGAFETPDQLYFMFPCQNWQVQIGKYKAHDRPWYQQMKAFDQEKRFKGEIFNGFVISQPYVDFFTHQIILTTMKSILSETGEFRGVLASDMLFQQTSKTLEAQSSIFTLYIVNENGLVMLTNFKIGNPTQHIFIFNQSSTGFNQSSWKDIKTVGISRVSNLTQCSLTQQVKIKNSQVMCAWNSRLNQTVIMRSVYIPRFQYFVKRFQSESVFEKSLVEQMKEFNYLIFTSIVTEPLIMVSLFAIQLCAMILAIKVIFSPLNNISLQAKTIIGTIGQARNNNQLSQLEQFTNFKAFQNIIDAFSRLINKLNDVKNAKNRSCLSIENIKYPKKNQLFKLKPNIHRHVSQNLLNTNSRRTIFQTFQKLKSSNLKLSLRRIDEIIKQTRMTRAIQSMRNLNMSETDTHIKTSIRILQEMLKNT